MKTLKKIAINTTKVLLLLYLMVCIGLYFFQESLIFFPRQLSEDFNFYFEAPFEEVRIPVKEADSLSALWFQQESSKGLVFYLHGNAGALDGWGNIAPTYLRLGYDVFLLDYRGFGKSTGSITSEAQFLDDVQEAYNWAKAKYSEQKITIIGYSIGTGSAAYLAANNQPKQLLLKAPYYSLVDMMQQHYAIVPTFLLKYRFETYTYLPQIKAPITIFHGTKDAVIPFNSSIRLKEFLKQNDQVVVLSGAGHNGMNNNPDYLKTLARLL
jgi:pimeloyl-ACP methyl ester carboxylesterase